MGVIFLGRSKTARYLKKASWKERGSSLKKAVWVLILPFIIAVFIYGGIATPTEASAIACIYAVLCSFVIYRALKFREIPRVLAISAGTSAMILMIVASARVFGYTLIMLEIPQNVMATIEGAQLTKIQFLLTINGILLILGCFLDPVSILLITSPIFLPVVEAMDINLIHFAIIYIVNMELAVITPPVGINLFMMSGITGQPIDMVLKGAIPFFLVDVAVLLLVTYVPWVSLCLVGFV